MSRFRRKSNRKNLKHFKKVVNYSAGLGQKSRNEVLHEYYKQNVNDTRLWQDTIIDMLIIFCYALNKEYGFGKTRVNRFYEKTASISQCVRLNYVTFAELEKILQEEAKYTYDHVDYSKENYSRENRIRLKTIEEVSVIMYFAMFEVYNFQAKRLKKIGACMAAETSAMAKGKITVADLEKVLDEKAHITFDKDFSHKEEATACW